MTVPHISRAEIQALQELSPFELKSALSRLAGEHESRTAFQMLNAGRGNPNFIAPTPRDAFFTLGRFAMEDSRANHQWAPELVGVPQKDGIADRFRGFLVRNADQPGIDLLRRTLDYGVEECGFDADSFVWELADSITGDHYPEPDRMLVHNEEIVHRYLMKELCQNEVPAERFDLFAVEGGTAAMCYIFDSLLTNRLIHKGDRIALMVPIFTPYLEIPELTEYDFEVVRLVASELDGDGLHRWQFPDEEIDKLRDPSIKALFCVNPLNPPSVRMADHTLSRIADIVQTDNPELTIITDDVYSTFIDGFRSLLAVVPRNTIGVYSYSKYVGATGWRLGVIAVNRDNIFDARLAALPEADKADLRRRYGTLTLEPDGIRFIDRLVADSRSVALNHTAGLSLPQQCQMLLFSAYCLLDREDHFKHQVQALIKRRLDSLCTGMGVTLPDDPLRVGYYVELDLLLFGTKQYGDEFAAWLQQQYEPTDILFRLAEETGVVLLNGGGFGGPEWSIRVSLANLRDYQYEQIGRSLRSVAEEYVNRWRQAGT